MKKLVIMIVLPVIFQLAAWAQLSPPVFTAQITTPSYRDEVILRVSGITAYHQAARLSAGQGLHHRTYLDGFGRSLQEVDFGSGTTGKPDIVSFSVYDSFGREKKSYLPYATTTSRAYQSNALAAQATFYATSTSTGKYAKDNTPYAEADYDNSPLNQVLRQGAVGGDWQLSTGKVQAMVTRTNTAGDNVRKFNSDGTSSGFWAAGSLSVSVLNDEENRQLLVFSDKAGHMILKREWVDETIQGTYEDFKNTYYIYHYSGLPLMVLPPKVVDRMAGSSWVLSADDLNHNVYRYEYDSQGRMTGKKLPSIGWVYMVYDKLDRLCLFQNAVQRAQNKWYFIKYDKQNRKILEGVLQDAVRTTRTLMQTYCDTYDYLNPAVPYYENKGGSIKNYTDLCFPQSTAFTAFEALTVNYYDSYDLDNNGTADYAYTSMSLGADEPLLGSSQGQLTVSSAKQLGTSNWITKAFFYDNRGRMVQQKSNNVTNLTLADLQTYVLDFAGQLKRSIKTKTINGAAHTADELIAYDLGARAVSLTHKYNNNTAVVIADYVYNELGQLVDKNLGKLATNSYLQSVDLRYNIRGWLTGINNSDLNNDGYNTETNDLFGMDLYYQGSGGIGNTGLFNGQISGVKWKSKMSSHPYHNVGRSYVYSYDKLGQLRSAVFKGNSGSGWTYRNGAFDEKNISYDLNGNLLSLHRNTWTTSSVSLDNLSYSYKLTGGTDQLLQVLDGNGTGGTYGFKNQSGDAEHYLYDTFGNLLTDKNRNVSYTYNDLGKVNRVNLLSYTNRYIQYTYAGSGDCLSKQIVDNGVTVRTISYVSGFVATDNVLSHMNMAEGRVRTVSGVGTYEYYIRDQVGQVRLSFENVSGVAVTRQENSFYAFGLVHQATIVPSGENKDIHADGEWENSYGNEPDLYTLSYRQYDPVLGRFNGIDPLCEKYTGLSVYHYGFNNPVSFSDPTGADPIGSWDQLWDIIGKLWMSPYGGNWNASNNSTVLFENNWDALWQYDRLYSQSWSFTTAGSFQQAYNNLSLSPEALAYRYSTASSPTQEVRSYGLREVNISETYSNKNWLVSRQKDAWSGLTNLDRSAGGSSFLDGFQTGLDVAGLVPVVGEAADGVNALIYTIRGDYVSAGLSAAGMIPFAGWAATGGKLLKKGGVVGAKEGTNLVYQGIDKAGVVRYVGITEREAAVRFGEHLSSGTAKSLLRYEVVPGATNLSRTGARVWEQTLINQYGLQKNGGLLLNKINSIAPKNWWQYGIK